MSKWFIQVRFLSTHLKYNNMIKKQCTWCLEKKELTEFYKEKNTHKSSCKVCVREYKRKKDKEKYTVDRKWRENKLKRNRKIYYNSKTDYWIIYLIDNFNGKGDHYVGITRQIKERLSRHRYFNVDTSYVLEMDRANSEEIALKYESEYHKRGYCGKKGLSLIHI